MFRGREMMRVRGILLLMLALGAADAIVQQQCGHCNSAAGRRPLELQKRRESLAHSDLQRASQVSTDALRGGAFETRPNNAAAPKSKEESRTTEAMAFFNSERIPAAFLSGASLSLMFAFPLQSTDALHIAMSKRLYIVTASIAFCNEIIAVFASSLAVARLLSQTHNPIADSAITMMLREVPLYFLAARTHFLSGLLFFAGALGIRMWAYFSDGCPVFARGMTFLMATTACFMLSLFNLSLTHADSFGAMWLHYLRVLWQTLREEGLGPVSAIGIVMLGATLWEAIQVMLYLYLASCGKYPGHVVEA